jgi:NodT family efflux transporter outer membrane factor (OMF) lipoprotein
MRRILILAGPLLVSACALGPNYTPPTPPQDADAPFVSADPRVTTDATGPDAWWKLYDDPVLNDLIIQAFAKNEDLKTAEANLSASRAILEGTRSSLYPQTDLKAGAVYGRDLTTDEILELTGREPQDTWLFDSLLDVSYELDLFGHVRRSIEAARDNSQAIAAARDGLRVTIAAETARAYGNICTLGEQLAVADRSLTLATQQQQIVEDQRDAGAGTDYDVAREAVVVAQTSATIPPLQGARQAALFELAALLGETPTNAPVTVEACVIPPHLTSLVPVGDGAALLRRRPDIREADRKLAQSLAEIGVAKADLFPRVTLSGFYGGASNQISLLGSGSGLAWGIGPAISWTFPNLQGPLAKLSQSKAGAAAALSNFESVVLQALKEVEQALAVYDAELGHHAALAAARMDAQRAFDQATDQYSAGQISHLDLLTSEQTLIGADTAIASSDASVVLDQIAVFKALGGGWQQ